MPTHHGKTITANVQKCNPSCTYCYVQQGEFCGKTKNMEEAVARQAVDTLRQWRLARDAAVRSGQRFCQRFCPPL